MPLLATAKLPSVAFEEVLAAQQDTCGRFLLEHRGEYPAIQKLFKQIEKEYGLQAENIFRAGKIPRVKLYGYEAHTMEQYLEYLSKILSGKFSARELQLSRSTKNMNWRVVQLRFTPEVASLVEAKRKKVAGYKYKKV